MSTETASTTSTTTGTTTGRTGAAHRGRVSRRRRAAAVALTCTALLATPVAGATAAPPAAPAPAPAAGVDAAAVQRALDALTTLGAQGVQVRITAGEQQSTARSGTATYGSERPVPVDGRFRAGSITKVFVSTVVLQLVGEGRVELDAPVSRYLPGLLPAGLAGAERITVRNLLQHTSGLKNYTEVLPVDSSQFPTWAAYEAARYRHWEPAELVGVAVQHPLDFQPGTGWHYSNTNYVVLGELVRAVTGRTYAQEAQARILEPLGLRSTSFPGDRVSLPAPHAHGYARLEGRVVNLTRLNPTVAGAAGELVSTTADLDRFLDALLGGELLPPALLAQMQSAAPATQGYGLGLLAMPTSCGPVWGHDGGIPGYLSLALSSPDTSRRLTASITTAPDANTADPTAYLQAVAGIVDEVFCG